MKKKDLIQLRKIFMEEASDLFEKIEKNLLEAEKKPEDASLVAALFRSIHTLKGSSGMIGSKKVTDFIHNLETIFDKVRSGAAALTPDIIDCTLHCMDHVKKLIVNTELTDPKDIKKDKELAERIDSILAGTAEWEKSSRPKKTKVQGSQTYHIYFKPNEDFFKDGSNPLLLVEELTEMGDSLVYAHIDINRSTNYDPTKCYTSWQVILATNEPQPHISDVFIFAQDQDIIEINKVSDEDLLQQVDFKAQMPKNHEGVNVTLDFVNEVIHSLDQEQLSDEEPEVNKVEGITSIRVASNKLDDLMNHVSELVTTQAGLSLYAKNNFDPTLDAIADNIEKLSRQLRDVAFDMTLIEIENLFSRFHRSVRDISVQLGKSVNFITEGGDTELDKTIIENLADPLMHLIRNSLDHGIETKEARLHKGKAEKGTITLRSFYSGTKVYVQIKDDGKGIDEEQIRKKAIKNGLIKESDERSKKEILDLIFVPGFSMAKDVTDISGRGVGMDVVKKNVLDLRGDINVESTIDEGTTITIGLPLTLSVIDGLQVRVHDTDYIFPLSSVEKCFELPRKSFINDFNHVVSLEGEQFPYIDLRTIFGLSEENAPANNNIIMVEENDRKVGFCVDEIVGEYQAVLKPVGKYYRNQEFVSGATILGDGRIALVLDANHLIASQNAGLKTVSV